MDHGWVIDLLPTRGLDQSILIAVLIGMWVMLAFTEVFGWVFIGVVVPGYLASVLVISPTTALAIIVEALVALVLSRFLAQTLNQTGAWTHFFGRDRFFLIVLVSVFVRQFDQTWLIPELTIYLRKQGFTNLDLGTDFSSIGLVLVPLAANMFWKLNALRGLVQITTVVGLTYLILRFGLLPMTNLSYSSFELTYENSAIDFVANAKAYVIMLTTAYLAGVVNLRYGWDFGGILVAALLALLWPTPTKLALTILESIVLLWAMKHLVRLPVIRNLNLEGPRKVCTVFTLAFMLKWMIGFAIGDHFPGLKITDLFAFGYLMSSLLAVRMLQKKSIRLVLLPALTTSVLGFAAGSFLGFLAQKAIGDEDQSAVPTQATVVSRRLLRSPAGVAAYAGARHSIEAEASYTESAVLDRHARKLWEDLSAWLTTNEDKLSDRVLHDVVAAKLVWRSLDQKFGHATRTHLIFAGEREDGTTFHGPMVLVNAGASGPVVLVRGAAGQLGLAEHGVDLCTTLRCRALVFLDRGLARVAAGEKPSTDIDEAVPLLRAFAMDHTVWALAADPQVAAKKPRLHLASTIEDSDPFEVSHLKLDWSIPSEFAAWIDAGADRLVRIHPDDLWHQSWTTYQQTSLQTNLQTGSGFIAQVWDDAKAKRQIVLRQAGNLPTRLPYSSTELRVLGRNTIGILLQEIATGAPRRQVLERVAVWAKLLNLQMFHLPRCEVAADCLAFAPTDLDDGVLLLVRQGGTGPFDLEIPRPRTELGTAGLGFAAWSALRARAFVLDLGPVYEDPTRAGEVRTAFQAIHQELDRAPHAGGHPVTASIVQIRGFSGQEPGPTAIVGIGTPLLDHKQIPATLTWWIGAGSPVISRDVLRISDGAPDALRFAAGTVPQMSYSRLLGQKDALSLWFSPEERELHRSRSGSQWLEMARLIRPLPRAALPDGITAHAMPVASLIAPQALQTPAYVVDRLPESVNEFQFLMARVTQVAASDSAGLGALTHALEHAQNLARYGHPQAISSLDTWLSAAAGRSYGLAHGLFSGLPWLWLEIKTKQTCMRALVLLGDAHEEVHVVNGSGAALQGPYLEPSQAFFRRSRTLLATCEPGGR